MIPDDKIAKIRARAVVTTIPLDLETAALFLVEPFVSIPT